MKFGGKIKEINQIIVSDPSYKKGEYGRYEKTNINAKNMDVSIQIHDYSQKIDNLQINGIEFFVLISNPDAPCRLMEDGSFTHYEKDKIFETDIGIDTACVAFGINKFADDIRAAQNEWQPPLALKTLSDGIFGDVKEGTEDGNINFIYISGFLDEDTDYSINDVVDYISKYLDVKDLYKEINGIRFPIANNDKDITDDMF